jgi:preprotein translocase subunit SecA
MRIFASDRVAAIMQKLGMGTGEAIEHPWVTRSIENAQRKVEARNFDMRKEILAYDDVANDQRKVIYTQRNELMAATDISEIITAIRADVINGVITRYIPPKTMTEQWDIQGLEEQLNADFNLEIPLREMLAQDSKLNEEGLRTRIVGELEKIYQEKEQSISADALRGLEKSVLMQVLDNSWKEHLAAMDYLRQGIHFRGYAQKDPKQEYKRESFEMFTSLLDDLKYEVVQILSKIKITPQSEFKSLDNQHIPQEIHFEHPDVAPFVIGQAPEEFDDEIDAEIDENDGDIANLEQFLVNDEQKIARNDPCPCGSGLKYKQCHGKLT